MRRSNQHIAELLYLRIANLHAGVNAPRRWFHVCHTPFRFLKLREIRVHRSFRRYCRPVKASYVEHSLAIQHIPFSASRLFRDRQPVKVRRYGKRMKAAQLAQRKLHAGNLLFVRQTQHPDIAIQPFSHVTFAEYVQRTFLTRQHDLSGLQIQYAQRIFLYRTQQQVAWICRRIQPLISKLQFLDGLPRRKFHDT